MDNHSALQVTEKIYCPGRALLENPAGKPSGARPSSSVLPPPSCLATPVWETSAQRQSEVNAKNAQPYRDASKTQAGHKRDSSASLPQSYRDTSAMPARFYHAIGAH
jgi:hypothetical protein